MRATEAIPWLSGLVGIITSLSSVINVEWCISQTQQHFIMFIIVLYLLLLL